MQCDSLIKKLYDAFTKSDMSLLEINPLIVTKEGRIVALDTTQNLLSSFAGLTVRLTAPELPRGWDAHRSGGR